MANQIYVRAIIAFLSFIDLTACSSENENSKDEELSKVSSPTEQKQANLTEYEVEVLSNESVGRMVNINFLYSGPTLSRTELENMANYLKNEHCISQSCNVISVWNDEKSFELYQDERIVNEEKKWMKKYWVKISESLILDYNVNVNQIMVYPFLDDQYRNYGGKMKRPL